MDKTDLSTTSVAVLALASNEDRIPLYLRSPHFRENIGYMYETLNSNLSRNYPILTSVWAYQEHMVAPRVLSFTESEVVFHCSVDVTCECESEQTGDEKSHNDHKATYMANLRIVSLASLVSL